MITDNLNPNFVKTFTVDYIFESKQEIRFDVIDVATNSVLLKIMQRYTEFSWYISLQ